MKQTKEATKKKSNAVVLAVPTSISPNQILQEGISKGSDLKLLKEAMELQFTWEKRQAEKAYNKAISDFKANPPEIIKESTVEFDTQKGKTRYKYAKLANVIEKVTPELSKHGLTVSWRTHQNGKVSVTCRISHELGHYEETTLSADNDNSGSKNPIQALGSAVSYLQRYSVLCLLGLACADADDDRRSKPSKVEIVADAKVVQQSLKDRVREIAKTKFKSPDLFKAWRIDNNLVENLEIATELQLSQVWAVLREVK